MSSDNEILSKIRERLKPAAREAFDEIRSVTKQKWEQPSGLDVGDRLTWAVEREKGEFMISLLADSEDTWAAAKASELAKKHSGVVTWTSVGEAQSLRGPRSAATGAASRRDLRPGMSIGHPRFSVGSIGCLLDIVGKTQSWIGVTSAAHVLALTESADEGDFIYSPGKPDCGRALSPKIRIGTLADATVLTPIHADEATGGSLTDHSLDIALVRISQKAAKRRKIPDFCTVPDPEDGRKRVKISALMPEDDLFLHLGEPVYTVGRTSGFRSGTLKRVFIERRQLKLPNRKWYRYSELLAVLPDKENQPFSDYGDSGALVYTKDGLLVGFVVGADETTTLCCSADRSLRYLSANLDSGEQLRIKGCQQ